MAALEARQKGVLRGMASALVLVVVALGLAIALHPPFLLPAGAQLSGRIAWGAAWLLGPACCLLVLVGRLAAHRFRTPADIDSSGLTEGSAEARVAQALIQNTLEQTVLAACAYLAYAALLPRGWLAALPVAAGLFVLGRVLFAAGYRHGAAGRAFGFALTFYGTAALLVLAVASLLLRLLPDGPS